MNCWTQTEIVWKTVDEQVTHTYSLISQEQSTGIDHSGCKTPQRYNDIGQCYKQRDQQRHLNPYT